MKRLYSILGAALTAIVAVSCSGNKNQGNDMADSVQDTITSGATQAVAEVDSLDYLSDDLKMFGLHGDVKEVRTIDYPSFPTSMSANLAFDDKGTLTSNFNDYTDNKFRLNENGFIREASFRESDGTTYSVRYTEWNEENLPVAGIYLTEMPDYKGQMNFSITYDKFDSAHNWLSRTYHGDMVGQDFDFDADRYADPVKEKVNFTERRRLSY